MLPFSEVLRELLIGLLTHGIFLNVCGVLDFFMNGVGVQIHHRDDILTAGSVEAECPHVFFHLGEDIALFVLQGESDIRGFRPISLLDDFFQSQNGDLWIQPQLRDFQAGDVVL